MTERPSRKGLLARQEFTPDERRILRRKIHIFTAVLGAGYLCLLAWFMIGGLPTGSEQGGVLSRMLFLIGSVLATVLALSFFAAQMKILHWLSERVAFWISALIALLSGPLLVLAIFWLIFLINSYF